MNYKNIFITGRPGIGKTTLIHDLFSRLSRYKIAGFYTSEIREKGVRKGFLISTFNGCEQTLAHEDLTFPHKVGKYSVNLAALEEIVTTLNIQDQSPDLWLIDEIGKMESLSSKFRQFIEQILISADPVIATISISAGGWIEQIRQRAAARVFEVSVINRDELPLIIAKLLEEIINEKKS
jgi:nucleoside-triphosphatase THEP1